MSAAAAPAGGGGKRKRKGSLTPAEVAFHEVIAALKARNPDQAWEGWERAERDGVKFKRDTVTPLLYLFTGFDLWAEHLRITVPNVPEEPPSGTASAAAEAAGLAPGELPALHLDRAARVLESVDALGALQDENQFAATARFHALRGDGAAALATADACAAALPATTRLRTYLPALMAFVKAGNLPKALEVHERMLTRAVGGDLSEVEYALLLQVCCSSGTREDVERTLRLIAADLTHLSLRTLQLAHNFYSACAPPESAQGWDLSWVDVDPQGPGAVPGVDSALSLKALSAADWAEFQTGLLEMAQSKEKSAGAFQSFVDWLDAHPTQVFLDGANIALYGQSHGPGFNWAQIEQVLAQVEARWPYKRVAVVLHTGRVHAAPSFKPAAKQIIRRLKEREQLFVTPKGSNDDWYWLYGVVRAGEAGVLVSNDEMRDHIFELLRPRFFLRWKAHHQCRYSVGYGAPEATLVEPPAFTTCVQQLPGGVWMLPHSPARWLCVRPVHDAAV